MREIILTDASGNRLIQSSCPVDLHPLAPVPVSTDHDVRAFVSRARMAQPQWENIPFKDRVRLIKKAGRKMLERRQEALELLHDEIGKTPAESLLSEAVGPLQYASDWAKVAGPWLKPRRLAINPLAFPFKKGTIEMLPRGVVGVIAPWNFPIGNFFKPIFPALLCGNAVLVKPSEYAPRSAAWFIQVLNEFLPTGVLNVIQGDKSPAQAMIRAGVDAITFTGSFRSGQEVAKLAGEYMIPCSMELGGMDAAIVLNDCDLDRTVAGILYWALHNNGQACAAIERVYVEDAIADRFAQQLSRAAAALRVHSGDPQTSDLGPCANAPQLAVVEKHVNDAISHGAKVLCGGKRTGQGLWFEPTVLDFCTPSMKVLQEPTFGPVISLVRVKSAEEAIQLSNQCDYGLTASIWSKNIELATQLARRLQVGTAYVNNHAFTGAIPSAPWSGVKKTGYGIANSTFALQHYTRPRTLVVDRKKSADGWWFPMDRVAEEMGHRLAEAQLGKIGSALRIPFLMAKRQSMVLDFARGKKMTDVIPKMAIPFADRFKRSLALKLGAFAKRLLPPLSSRELRWGLASMETIFSNPLAASQSATNVTLPLLSKQDAQVFLIELFGQLPWMGKISMRAAFWMIGLAPIFQGKGWTTLDQLSASEQLLTLQKFSDSQSYLVRQSAIFLKLNGSLSHAATTRFHAALGNSTSLPNLANLPTLPNLPNLPVQTISQNPPTVEGKI